MYNAYFVFFTSLYSVRLTVNKGFKMNACPRFTIQNHECLLTPTMF